MAIFVRDAGDAGPEHGAQSAHFAHESIQGGRGAQNASVPGAAPGGEMGWDGGEGQRGRKKFQEGPENLTRPRLAAQISEESQCGKVRGALRRTKPLLKPIPVDKVNL